MEIDLGKLWTNFRSTGAKDHPMFWVNGAEHFIPNMLECMRLTNYEPTVTKYDTYENEHTETMKNLFIKHGSDKFINPYYKYYSNVLTGKNDLNILALVYPSSFSCKVFPYFITPLFLKTRPV